MSFWIRHTIWTPKTDHSTGTFKFQTSLNITRFINKICEHVWVSSYNIITTSSIIKRSIPPLSIKSFTPHTNKLRTFTTAHAQIYITIIIFTSFCDQLTLYYIETLIASISCTISMTSANNKCTTVWYTVWTPNTRNTSFALKHQTGFAVTWFIYIICYHKRTLFNLVTSTTTAKWSISPNSISTTSFHWHATDRWTIKNFNIHIWVVLFFSFFTRLIASTWKLRIGSVTILCLAVPTQHNCPCFRCAIWAPQHLKQATTCYNNPDICIAILFSKISQHVFLSAVYYVLPTTIFKSMVIPSAIIRFTFYENFIFSYLITQR